MTDVAGNSQAGRRRRKRVLSAEEKYEIYLALVAGEMSQNEAADRYGVDRSTIARIRTVGKEAELRAAKAEVERLDEIVKEQAVELVTLRTKSRWG